jgi:hypothetical protein
MDCYATPKSKDNIEYLVVYTVCFCVLLLPVTLRRLRPRTQRKATGLSVFSETSAMAANCATSSFMGM